MLLEDEVLKGNRCTLLQRKIFKTTQKHSFSAFRSSVLAFNVEKTAPNNLTNVIIPVHKATP